MVKNWPKIAFLDLHEFLKNCGLICETSNIIKKSKLRILFQSQCIKRIIKFFYKISTIFSWSDGNLFFNVGEDLNPNVVGVLHQVKKSFLFKLNDLLIKAIRELERKSIVNFKIRDKEKDFIDLYRGGGCSSKIGRVGGRQEIC